MNGGKHPPHLIRQHRQKPSAFIARLKIYKKPISQIPNEHAILISVLIKRANNLPSCSYRVTDKFFFQAPRLYKNLARQGETIGNRNRQSLLIIFLNPSDTGISDCGGR